MTLHGTTVRRYGTTNNGLYACVYLGGATLPTGSQTCTVTYTDPNRKPFGVWALYDNADGTPEISGIALSAASGFTQTVAVASAVGALACAMAITDSTNVSTASGDSVIRVDASSTTGLRGLLLDEPGAASNSIGWVHTGATPATARLVYSVNPGVPVPTIDTPTLTAVGDTTATAGFSTDTATGNAYFLRRTGSTPASAATVIATGESQAISATGAQVRAMTAFTSGLTYYVDMARTGSTGVVTVGPFYPGTGRPVSDVTVTGWVGSAGGALAALINENVASDAEYITSPALSGSATAAIFNLDKTYMAGTYSVKVRAAVDTGSGVLRVKLLNGSNVQQGVTADQAISTVVTTYTLPITITGSATRISVEVTT